jgi:hypothetical protein
MPISFDEAKARVSPDAPVAPGSKEFNDILELMRQSGHIFPEDNTPAPPLPPPKKREDLMLFRERPEPTPKRRGISKSEWLSVDVNKAEYEGHIQRNTIIRVPMKEPDYRSWAGKVAPKMDRKMSKGEWAASLK